MSITLTDHQRLVRALAVSTGSVAAGATLDVLVALLRNPGTRIASELGSLWLFATVGTFVLTGNLCMALSQGSDTFWRRIYAGVYSFVAVAFTFFVVWWVQFTTLLVETRLLALFPQAFVPYFPVVASAFGAYRYLRGPRTAFSNVARTA